MRYKIDNSHFLAEFSVKHMMVSTVKGKFTAASGEIEWDENEPTRSWARATINARSITTGDEKRDAHLLSADFFDVEQYPTITFESTKTEPKNGKRYTVTGNLSMHGITKPIIMEVEYNGQAKNPWGQLIAGFSARTSINRTDFGLNWNVALELGGVLVSDKIDITLEVEGIAQTSATSEVKSSVSN